MIMEKLRVVAAAEPRQAASLQQVGTAGESAAIPVFGELLIGYRVRHGSRATFSRQPRQVRKEATVTGSFVCSGSPVPGFFVVFSGGCDDESALLHRLSPSRIRNSCAGNRPSHGWAVSTGRHFAGDGVLSHQRRTGI